MKAARILKITFVGLASHAFRAFLAALGVVLGVGAVVAMMAISEGARRESLERIRAMGIENIVVESVKPPPGSESARGKQQSQVDAYGITQDEMRHVQNTFENVRSLVPVRNMHKDIYLRGERSGVKMMATTGDFLHMTGSSLVDSRSRFLNGRDGDDLKCVCVVGRKAARTLFGFRDPIGQSVSAGTISFEVVGILENTKGSKLAGTHDIEELVYVPFQTGNAVFGEALPAISAYRMVQVEIDYLYVPVRDIEQIPNTAQRLRCYLAQTHEQIDYRIQVPYELMKQQESTQWIFAIVMASIAAISLLVGGIGIMNIMLANIYERTREIGTRRALGATRRDILVQFLAESVVLTGIGGIIGVAAGVGIAAVVEGYAQMDTVITPLSVGLSLGVAILTGVTFGTYPAWKAANLDPIVALRHE
jgi:putative ABC transport system permease protein